jgi:serine/threonine protein kinase
MDFVFPDSTNFKDFIENKSYLNKPHTLLGQGSYANVYRLHFLSQDYVLKHVTAPPEDLEKEIAILEALKNKWFAVQIIAHLIYPDNAYILYPYVDGQTLSSLQRAKTDNKKAVFTQIYNDLVEATLELHKMHIIHHDIKPQNIWIPTHGKPFFLDFGLSDKIGTEKGFIGTPGYYNSRRWLAKGRQIKYNKNTGQYVANRPLPISPNINWYALGTVFNTYDPNSNGKNRILRRVNISNNTAKLVKYGNNKTRKSALNN